MKRPLVAVVSAYVIGLLFAQLSHPPLTALIAASGCALVLVCLFAKFRAFSVWPFFALVGWTNFAAHTAILWPQDLRNQLGNDLMLVNARGVLAETPRLKITLRDDEEHWRSVARVYVHELRRDQAFQPAVGEVLVATPGVLGADFFAGQTVEITGVIAPPPPPLAEGLFDYREYLATRGIYYQLRAESTNDWKLLEPRLSTPPLTDRFLNWSHRTLAMGLPVEDEPLRLLWAMTLDWRTAFTGDISEPFLRSGTQHMFAIDGLRIALLSGMIVGLLGVLRVSRAWCGAIAIPLIWFYTAATGWEASAMRASVMMTVVLGGWVLKRPGDLLNSLAVAALVILLADPRQLLEASFQLSFMVMLVISLLLPPWNKFFDALLSPDSLLPKELVPPWKKAWFRYGRRFARFVGLSFAAWVGCLPLAAKYFHLFSPVSTLANLFAVPLGSFALMANLGSLVCGHWLPWLTVLFNHAAWFCMVAMTWVSVEAARLPGAYFYVPEPSWISIAIYYGVLLAALSGWFVTARRVILGSAVLLVIGGVYFWQWQSSRDEIALTVLPLSGGHVVYVDADGRSRDWLINCGSEDAANRTLKDFLRGQGVNSLPRLLLADGSARNCGGALLLDDLFGVRELWTSGAKFRSAAYRGAAAQFEKPPSRSRTISAGDEVGCWQALFPAAGKNFAKADDGALVLLGHFHGARVLLLNELSRAGQSELLAQTNDLRADIVITGLPSEGEPVCDALIEAVQPKVIVVADSEFPATRRAGAALRERLARENIPVIYTRSSGAVKLVADTRGWSLRAMDGQRFSFP